MRVARAWTVTLLLGCVAAPAPAQERDPAAAEAAALRAAVSNPKKCTDTLVASLTSACATTVDGLVDSTGTGGCLVTDDVSAADQLIDSVY